MASRVLALALIALTVMISACGKTTYKDVGHEPGSRELIGTTYTVVRPLTAYGIREHSKAAIEYFTLIPPPGIAGSEVGSRVPIAIGSTLTVISVYETNRLLDPSVTLGVKLNGAALPENLPVRLDLMRGNEGVDRLGLNSAIFEKR